MDFMQEAIKEANRALELNEVPVGVVIVKDNKILARAHNLKESEKDVTCHAELLAIRQASKMIDNWRLSGCSMYVTLEPCPMCAGAIIQSRISSLYIGTFNTSCGACGSVLNLIHNPNLNSFVNVKWLYNDICSNILEEFFKLKRPN
ncbi:tRNA-specific adenosine deaminase [Clostridium tyrobutyricum]|uniref:tRNA-specific adenosine deaminase n=1 Tax=Clostridium tyrobutyricum DIVETGP TaxID=1408889 RepID=W6N6F8_CLOTY|nr:nucleoside deaminase [Clostridium tyrobutyricum]AND83294.1 cytosine deaminase [Clostridium tyrobutyricum]ANP70809.1 tRNA-specific adenosine deaminase [Clostridium tyrobutyricum]MBR9648289.1 nucleoside deaminase [Clostridium tyrobutyricum]MBV4417042.1 nucleoside deaminase [Clostridium tyrobutyricum]MBV4423184.1 nucleoside deaminase [Clostridium tyrobutyricum]